MNKKIKEDNFSEEISSLIDDELSAREQRRLLNAISESNALRNKMMHYQMIRRALKDELDQIDFDVRDQVYGVIRQEKHRRTQRSWLPLVFILLPIIAVILLILFWPKMAALL
ncbi:MAG: sigma-E factor negative regulatory protein [Legionellales bacterium]|nr:sigma-E factor negative regulatory protein [Legionellales bacterium]